MSAVRTPTVASPHRSTPQPRASTASTPGPRLIDSRELFLGQSVLLIGHLGETYRLQTTRLSKLILTK